MTSIEWLIDQINNKAWGNVRIDIPKEMIEQAKEMHKQEILDAFTEGASDGFYGESDSNREKYYQETFVSKGTDEHIVDTNEMISDKDIFNVAFDKYVIEDEIEAFIQGANWMQEQLKTK